MHHPETAYTWWLHTFGRLDTQTCIGAKSWYYYCTTIPWQLLLWNLAALFGVFVSVQRYKNEKTAQVLPPVTFFATDGFFFMRRNILLNRNWKRVSLGSPATAAWAVLLPLAWSGPLAKFWWDILLMGSAALVLLIAMFIAYRHRYFQTACILLFGLIWIGGTYAHIQVFPKVDNYQEDTLLLHRLNDRTETERPVLLFAYFPERELAYLDGPVPRCDTIETLLATTARSPDAHILTTRHNEAKLSGLGIPVLIDQAPSPTTPSYGASVHLAVYQIRWD